MTRINFSPNMTCLVVEDNQARIDWFSRVLPNFEIATDSKSAIQALDSNNFDMVFLDHDSVNYFRVISRLRGSGRPSTICFMNGTTVTRSNPDGLSMAFAVDNPNYHVASFH